MSLNMQICMKYLVIFTRNALLIYIVDDMHGFGELCLVHLHIYGVGQREHVYMHTLPYTYLHESG